MSEKTQSGLETCPQPEVTELPKENIREERTYALLESEDFNSKKDEPDLTEQPGVDLGDDVAIQLKPPIYEALNGSGRIILQMERTGDIKDKKSGLIITGNTDIGKTKREIGPIPSDAMWFVVKYDPDINIHYRTAKLKELGLHDIRNHKDQRMINKMEENGELDVVRIGDRVFFNHINFIPVKIRIGFQENYIAHHYDILGVLKSFPRNRLELPQPALEVVK